MKKVLITTGNLARNGTEAFIMNTYRNLNLSEFKVDFLLNSIDPEGYAEEVRLMGSEIFLVPSRRRNPIKHYISLWQFFKKYSQNYDVIHCCVCSLSEIALMKMAKHFSISEIIVHAHNSASLNKFTIFLHNCHKITLPRYANRFLACSESSYKWFFEGIIPRSEVDFIRNGIDVDRFTYNIETRKAIRAKFGISETTIVLGHVGRFTYAKNHKHLINVLAEFVVKGYDVLLMMVGAGEMLPEIKHQAEMSGVIDRVIFLGLQQDVAPFLQAMDCFIMPSIFEGLPFALVEAQASGLPVVASTNISSEADITGNAVFLSLQDPLSLWVEECVKLIDKCKRKDTSQIIVEAGYAIIDTAKRVERIYLGL